MPVWTQSVKDVVAFNVAAVAAAGTVKAAAPAPTAVMITSTATSQVLQPAPAAMVPGLNVAGGVHQPPHHSQWGSQV